MAIKTNRTQENAQVTVDQQRCRHCGLCAVVCGATLRLQNGQIIVDQEKLFGCIGCGQCVAVCPENCISVEGRTLLPEDVVPIAAPQERTDYESLYSLLLARRSVRNYTEREVPQEVIEEILRAATTAPMGLPPSDVSVMVLGSREKVRQFSDDFIDHVTEKRWMFSRPALSLFRPFMGKKNTEMMENFVAPFVDLIIEGKKEGKDYLLYGAPLAMLFQGSPYSDPADSQIAATYAMLAGEALGLGTCMIGAVPPLLKHARQLRKKYPIRPDMKQGLMVLFGYPAVQYVRGVRRSFAHVDYI